MGKKKKQFKKSDNNTTEFGEIIPSMFLWQSQEERKRMVEKLETITDDLKNDKKQIPPS